LTDQKNKKITLYQILGSKQIEKIVNQVLQDIKPSEFLKTNFTIKDLKYTCENFINFITNGPYEFNRKTNEFDLFLKMDDIRFEEFKNSIIKVFKSINVEEIHIDIVIAKINKERLDLVNDAK
jgi:hypothetical protein